MPYRADPWHPPSPAPLQRLQVTCPGSQPGSGRNPVCRIRGEDLLLMPFEHLTRYHLLHNGKGTATLLKKGMPVWEGLQTSFIWRVSRSRALPHSAICWPLLEMPAVQTVERKLLDVLINFLLQKLFCTPTMCQPLHVTIFLPLRSLYSLVLISLIGGDKQ